MDVDGELELLRARLRGRIESSRSLVRRARLRAASQDRDAVSARARAREHLGHMIAGWIALNGLAAGPAPDERGTDGTGPGDVLRRVLDVTRAVFPGCSSISVTTVDQLAGDAGPYRTALGTGVAPAVDALQYRLGEGPCVDAVELDMVTPVHADDLAGGGDAQRWPDLCREIGGHGIRSALSIAVPWSALRTGLQADQHALGAINLYAPEPRAFTGPEVRALMLGSWAGSVVSGHGPAEVFHGSP